MDYGSPVSVFTTMWLAFSLGNQYTSKPCPAVGSTAQKRVWPLSSLDLQFFARWKPPNARARVARQARDGAPHGRRASAPKDTVELADTLCQDRQGRARD